MAGVWKHGHVVQDVRRGSRVFRRMSDGAVLWNDCGRGCALLGRWRRLFGVRPRDRENNAAFASFVASLGPEGPAGVDWFRPDGAAVVYRDSARTTAAPPRVVPAAPDPADVSEAALEQRAAVSAAIRAQAAAGKSAPVAADLFPDLPPAPRMPRATKGGAPVTPRPGLPSGYRWEYVAGDLGTERAVRVFDAAGCLIGQRDPFHPGGVPALSRARVSRCREVAAEIAREADEARPDDYGRCAACGRPVRAGSSCHMESADVVYHWRCAFPA